MATPTEVAEGLVLDWLDGEHSYQFNKNIVTHNANPRTSLDYIMSTELKNKWHRFRNFRDRYKEFPDKLLYLQAGQQIMKATGAARGAMIWDNVSRGSSLRSTSRATLSVLGAHFVSVLEGRGALPDPALLDSPFEEAIDPYSTVPIEGQYQILPIYTRLAGLAVHHLLEQEESTGEMELPRPGTPSGTIEPWHP